MRRGEGRPKNGYYQADGTRRPGTTTITGRGADKSQMMKVGMRRWYERGYKDGSAGVEPDAVGPYWSDGDALQAGTIVHNWIEADIHNPEGNEIEHFVYGVDDLTKQQAQIGFMAYRQWRKSVNLEILETEVPLVSEEYGFGGTLDAIALINGERCIFDWKTSNGTYPDYIAQVAAYRQLWNETNDVWGDDPKRVSSAHLLRVGKDYGDFHHHYWGANVLDMGWEWFLNAKGLYEMDKRLKKVAS